MMVNVFDRFSTFFSKEARLNPAEVDAILSTLDTQPYPPHDKEPLLNSWVGIVTVNGAITKGHPHIPFSHFNISWESSLIFLNPVLEMGTYTE